MTRIQQPMKKPWKILISAYACKPKIGSEGGVGWSTVRELARHCQEVWLITRKDNHPSIEAELQLNPLPELKVYYYDLPQWLIWWRKERTVVYLHYYFWQLGIYFAARNLHSQEKFDLIHHVTYGRYCYPVFLALLPVPFIWGPVGGGEVAPKGFWKNFDRQGKLHELLRSLSCRIGEFDPFVKLTAKRSAMILVCTRETSDRVTKLGAKRVKQILGQTGIDREDWEILEKHTISPNHNPIRFISIGRLLHWKGFDLGLRAFARANIPESEYWIVGDGSQRSQLETLVRELGIVNKVKFLGELSRHQTLEILGTSSVLIHPSLHDFSPTVCIEAMAAGKPVICLDLGGPAVQITDTSGFKVKARNAGEAITGICEAMQKLAVNREMVSTMAIAAKTRAREEYTWDIKGLSIVRLYEEVLHREVLTHA
ncbi:glycosyltransferase family 4 protein [Calothrix sp. PCC 6303]|uniref:glycosyltransferase family 4 protein n=1 Tax=Calothrix sp. PCC 6303 TaxID=1170562 RepID=UPI0002A0459D|nr:glycosyltransferase family 4 protein [Calothrix sp. PCC 6303]AFZ01172.1 glycosyl transferase group 1 [Calothrix sp. PCC 6303]